jgi:hypothetical protein
MRASGMLIPSITQARFMTMGYNNKNKQKPEMCQKNLLIVNYWKSCGQHSSKDVTSSLYPGR